MALLAPGQNAFGNTSQIGKFANPDTSLAPSPFQGFNSSTAPTSGNLLQGSYLGRSLAQGNLGEGPVRVNATPTGGVSFDPSRAAAINSPTSTPVSSTPSGLNQYITSSSPTQGGGTITTNADGNPVGYTPNGFSLDTNKVPSSALTSNIGLGDIAQSHSQYQDYVDAVAKAQGYSPEYLQALQGQYGAQTRGAQLGLNQAALNSNFYTGNNLPGDTLNYAQGATAKAQAQNTLEQAQNSIQQLSANQALNTQQLARTGNISAAQTQLQYSPAGMSGANAINQYNTLQQQYPNADIPEYNNSLSPALNQQIAQELVANSPAYKAGFTSTYQNAQGGTDILNKLSLGSLQQNSDGTYSLVNGADKALGDSNAKIVQDQANIYSNIDSALTSFGKTAQSTIQFANQYGLNQSDIPYINQINNAIKAKTAPAGALAAFKTDITNLQNDYAAFLTARKGSVAGTNEEAANTIDINKLSPAQMQIVFSQMQNDGKNTQSGALQQIQKATQGLQTNQAASSIGNNSSVGSSWDDL